MVCIPLGEGMPTGGPISLGGTAVPRLPLTPLCVMSEHTVACAGVLIASCSTQPRQLLQSRFGILEKTVSFAFSSLLLILNRSAVLPGNDNPPLVFTCTVSLCHLWTLAQAVLFAQTTLYLISWFS